MLENKIQTLKDRGDIGFVRKGMFTVNYLKEKVRKADSVKRIVVGVDESRKELLENKIKTNYYQEKYPYGI